MSEEDVETFKRAIEAANRGDVEGILAELDPGVGWHAALPMLGGDAVYRGHEEVRGFLTEIWDVLRNTECFAENWVGENGGLPDHAAYRGRDGVRERERGFREAWGDLTWEAVEFIDAGDASWSPSSL